MDRPLLWFRFLVPLAAALYTVIETDYRFEASYTVTFLAYLFIARQRMTKALGTDAALLLAETALSAVLCERYGGLLFLCFHASLLSLHGERRWSGKPIVAAAAMLLAVMTASVRTLPVDIQVIAFLTFATTALLLYQFRLATGQKQEIEQLYDELRRKHYELEEARKRIVDFARKVENASQAEERNRIARDIHDDLGHRLIRIKMMMEAVLQIFPLQPAKGMELAGHVRDELSQSMETLRATVRKLKPGDEEMNAYSIFRFFEQAHNGHGIQVTHEISGIPYGLYPSAEMVLTRNAQEALTNAVRHGEATEIHFHLHFDPNQVVLSASNNGIIPSEDETNARGLGLSGMEERVRLLGGKLVIDAHERFTVTTFLPNYIQTRGAQHDEHFAR